MRWRVLLAVAFVAIVGGLIALRDQGYLGGRLKGGPLQIGGSSGSARVVRAHEGMVPVFGLRGSLEGGPVRVQNVRSRIVSPELEVLGPNVATRPRRGRSAWPPSDATVPLEDATLRADHPEAIMGLRAQRAGVYYAIGLIVDYRRGQRRYRDRESQRLCVSFGRRQRCDPGYDGPGAARVAQVGGPARYPRARLTPTEAVYSRPGERRLRITLSNQSRSVIDISELAFDRNPSGVAIVATEPEELRLAPHGYQSVRLRVTVPEGCDERFARLRAELDSQRRSIPLSLPLRFAC